MLLLSSASPPKQKIIISLSAVAIIVSGLIILLIYPCITRIKELSNEIFTQRVELEKIYLRGQNLKQTLEQYQQIKPTVLLLNRAYIQSGQELDLFTSLENLSENNNIVPNIKLTSTTPKEKTIKTLPLQITLVSNFTNLMNYLVGLENLDYYLNISTIRINTGSVNPQEVFNNHSNITTLLLANAYYKP
ncbi:MAG: hypothetical protein WC575_00230 [Patescibacteria group bacterium]